MPSELKPLRKNPLGRTPTAHGSSSALQRHSTWVREHPIIEPTPFPDYPDEPSRRGALPNGNPWRSELTQTTQPGPRRSSPPPPLQPSLTSQRPRAQRLVHAPPQEALPVGIVSPRLRGAGKRIANDVATLLASSKILEGKRIEIDVEEGAVVMRGRLPTAAARREAEMIASSVRGVTQVDNRIALSRSRS